MAVVAVVSSSGGSASSRVVSRSPAAFTTVDDINLHYLNDPRLGIWYTLFLIMGNAGFISSTVLYSPWRYKGSMETLPYLSMNSNVYSIPLRIGRDPKLQPISKSQTLTQQEQQQQPYFRALGFEPPANKEASDQHGTPPIPVKSCIINA